MFTKSSRNRLGFTYYLTVIDAMFNSVVFLFKGVSIHDDMNARMTARTETG